MSLLVKVTTQISELNDLNTQIASAAYAWLPMNNISDYTIFDPLIYPTASNYYIVKISTIEGCDVKDSLLITVNNMHHIIESRIVSEG